jgi:hypothetical protein
VLFARPSFKGRIRIKIQGLYLVRFLFLFYNVGLEEAHYFFREGGFYVF